MANEREYFERLTLILREHGFGWVVTQAQTEILEGKSVTKEVKAPEISQTIEDDTFVRRTRKRRRASLVSTQPYNHAERLSILLRGIETAIIDRAKVEETVLSETDGFRAIEFFSDDILDAASADGIAAHTIRRERLEKSEEVRENLSEALSSLQELANAST